MQHTDLPAAMQIAEQRGNLRLRPRLQMIKFGPKSQLTAIVDNWAPYYIQRTKDVLDGTWKSEDTWGGLKSKMVVMAPFTNMPDDVKKLAEGHRSQDQGRKRCIRSPARSSIRPARRSRAGAATHLADGQILEHELLRQGHRGKIPGQVIRVELFGPDGSGHRRPD